MHNNPVKYVDPTGENPLVLAILAVFGVYLWTAGDPVRLPGESFGSCVSRGMTALVEVVREVLAFLLVQLGQSLRRIQIVASASAMFYLEFLFAEWVNASIASVGMAGGGISVSMMSVMAGWIGWALSTAIWNPAMLVVAFALGYYVGTMVACSIPAEGPGT